MNGWEMNTYMDRKVEWRHVGRPTSSKLLVKKSTTELKYNDTVEKP